MEYEARSQGQEFVERLLLHWRVRCVLRRVSIEATAGPDALDLCAAVVETLCTHRPPPGLVRAARTWGSSVHPPADVGDAVQCLAEIATELAADVFEEFPTDSLGVVLEMLAAEASAASAWSPEPDTVDSVTGCPDRRSFDRRLDDAVARAMLHGGDVAVAVMALDQRRRRVPRRRSEAVDPDTAAAVHAAVVALRRVMGGDGSIYRLGPRKIGLLLPGAGRADAGALMLRATCAGAPEVTWGAGTLRGGGVRVLEDPEALLLVAEADHHRRRRDLTHARMCLARQRRRTALSSVAAALALVAGVTFGIRSAQPQGGPSQLAVGAGSSSPGHYLGPGARGSDGSSPSVSVPLASSGPTDVSSGGTGSSGSHVQLVEAVTPAPAPGAPAQPPNGSGSASSGGGSGGGPPPGPGDPVGQLVGTAGGLVGGLVGSIS